MKELLQILAVMFGIAIGVWIVVNLSTSFNLWVQRKFGFWPGYNRTPKSEAQTLFQGNTKDQDQI